MSPTGYLPDGTYSTTIWTGDETDTENGVAVVHSRGPMTYALTGVVISQMTEDPVAGATVTLQPCNGCSPQPAALVTSTDSSGGFAFVDVDPSTLGLLTITASGLGSYTIHSSTHSGGEGYQMTARMNGGDQVFNGATNASTSGDATQEQSYPTYDSERRIPPWIRIAMYPRNEDCEKTSESYNVVYKPWNEYVLRTMTGEIYGGGWPNGWFGEHAAKATAAAISNYAWYERKNPVRAPAGADVTNTIDSFQCYREDREIPFSWRVWVADVYDERIVDSRDRIQSTPYRGEVDDANGFQQYTCSDSAFPANGNKLNQLGAKALDEQCGYNNWRSIVHYYYTYRVRRGLKPPAPRTSFNNVTNPGAIKFNFVSRVSPDSPVGWKYELERWIGSEWRVIRKFAFNARLRKVPDSYVYPTFSCSSYRVRAWNPVGWSFYSSFNGGAPICSA
jgi:hypothetical protein